MHLKLQKTFLPLPVIATLMLITYSAAAQNDTTPKKRLQSPARVKGFIGGESHDSYVIRARQGQVMTVQFSWRRKGDNHAEFTVSESSNFFNAQRVKFGKSSNNGKRWEGRIPHTQNYYIYVVGHPEARYTLRVATR